MRSLTFKLILALLAVSMIGVVLVALYASQRTQNEFDRFMLDREQARLAADLTQYYQTYATWDGAESVYQHYYSAEGRPFPPMMFPMLANADGRVLVGRMAGSYMPAAQLRRGVALRVKGQIVGWLLPDSAMMRSERAGFEQAFLGRVRQAILVGALGAAAAALALSILLARTLTHPIHELIAATRALARGELGRQVPVRADDELGQLAASFNQMSQDLARASQLRRQMTADIAHELRTPLSLIMGYTEGLSDGKLQPAPETFAIMHDEAQRLNRLVEDLRTLSLAEAGELPLMRQPLAPQALLEHVALAYAARAENQNISLQVQTSPDLPSVNVDRDRMAQVLGNLISNALRYTPAGGQINLAAQTSAGKVLLSVQDTGVGIAVEDLPHVFDRFYRGDKSRSRQEGESGLGLAIARSLVEMHGGTITVASTPGQGATFTITLPAA